MTLRISILVFFLFHSFCALAGEKLYFLGNGAGGPFVDTVELLSSKKILLKGGPWSHEVLLKKKSAGTYSGKVQDFGKTIKVEVKLSTDHQSMSWTFTVPDHGPQSASHTRIFPSTQECVTSEGANFCLMTSFVTPPKGERLPGFFQIRGFWENQKGEVIAFRPYHERSYRSIEEVKGSEIIDLENPEVKCAKQNVCIGQRRQVRHSKGIDIFGFKDFATIVAFSRFGFVTKSDHDLMVVYDLARTDVPEWTFVYTAPKDCDDYSRNELLQLSELARKEAQVQCLGSGRADACVMYRKDYHFYRSSEDKTQCLFRRRMTEWVSSPLEV